MSASPRLDTPARPSHDPAAEGASTPRSGPATPPARRRPFRLIAALLAVLVLAGVGTAVQSSRQAEAEAAERLARTELARDVETLRTAIADPARDGQRAATALLRHQLLVVAGEAPDASVGERLLGQLRGAADQLDEAAGTPIPDRPDTLPDATLDPIFTRLEGLDARVTDLAATFRSSADDADAWLAAVRDLEEAAIAYADASEDLPSDDDPDVVADAWRAERERLDGYTDAVARAADHEASATLAAAHAELVEGMGELADDAVGRLEAGDLDGYNAALADRLEGDDPFGFGAALEAARDEVADAAIAGPLEDARGLALGLLTELEELRRTTPAQLAELR